MIGKLLLLLTLVGVEIIIVAGGVLFLRDGMANTDQVAGGKHLASATLAVGALALAGAAALAPVIFRLAGDIF